MSLLHEQSSIQYHKWNINIMVYYEVINAHLENLPSPMFIILVVALKIVDSASKCTE